MLDAPRRPPAKQRPFWRKRHALTSDFWAACDEVPYSSYEVDPSPTVPSGVVYRPEVTIDVIGTRRMETIQALVDTGSDETIFPASLAQAIGVQVDHASAGQASAVGGHAVQLVPGSVVLEITQGEQNNRWRTTVGFLEAERPEDEVALLGYAGFLEFFRAAFDSQNHELELTANDRLPYANS